MSELENQQRRYWAEQFNAAYHFMFDAILPYPVLECGEPLVSLPEVANDARVQVFFSETNHVRGLPRLFYLRKGQIKGFIDVATAMNKRGWVLRVEDGYRTAEMQKYLGRTPQVFDGVLNKVMWELGGKVPTPEFMFKRCSTLVASVPKFGTHMSGSAIDISVFKRDNPSIEIDRGAPYLEVSALTPMNTPFISAEAKRNRQEINDLMWEHGFVDYPYEFWHYSSGDAYDQYLRKTNKPAIYGAVNWDPNTNKVTPFANPVNPLNTFEEIRTEINAALNRINKK
jgi:D-alanyl-D-alanine dipeptidase